MIHAPTPWKLSRTVDALQKIYANAAESPEWIRNVIDTLAGKGGV